MLLIKNGLLHDAVHPVPYTADILIENGKIARVSANIDEPAAELFDAQGMDIFPGFIDAHTHIGMFGHSGYLTQDDVEKGNRCVPSHRAVDAVNPQEDSFESARSGGVTCVCIAPGSVSCIAGSAVVLKTYGVRIDDMIVKNPVAMKIAFGENPKSALTDKLTSRLTIASTIRDTLHEAKEYAQKKEQGLPVTYSPKYEALLPVIRKEIPLKAHAHRCDDIFTAIRIAKELDVRLTLEHVSDGGMIADTLAAEGYPIVLGPYLSQSKKDENSRKSPADAIQLINAGCSVSVMTDSPIVEECYLPLCAGLFMREGLSEFEALKTITINPARHLGIEDRVGSIEVGKDADLVLSHGCPMDMRVKPKVVFGSGQIIFSALSV